MSKQPEAKLKKRVSVLMKDEKTTTAVYPAMLVTPGQSKKQFVWARVCYNHLGLMAHYTHSGYGPVNCDGPHTVCVEQLEWICF